MARKHYKLDEVLRSLLRKNGLYIDNVRKEIEVLKNQTDLGNGSWGKLDFLENYCGYRIYIVNRFS